MTPRIQHAIAKELYNILDISIFMNMLAFDPIRTMHHDFLTVSQYFTIPPKLYIRGEAVDRLGRREAGDRQEKNNIRRRN